MDDEQPVFTATRKTRESVSLIRIAVSIQGNALSREPVGVMHDRSKLIASRVCLRRSHVSLSVSGVVGL